jgi:hypothetical protein
LNKFSHRCDDYSKVLVAIRDCIQQANNQSVVNKGLFYSETLKISCLKSLSFGSIDSRKHDIKSAHYGTCDWLFETPEFRQWIDREDVETHNGVFWIKGKAGAGKSTLMKHNLSHCQETLSDHVIANFFFNARGGDLEKSPLGMFRSLVLQMLENNSQTYERFLPLYIEQEQRHGKNWAWELGQLRDFVLREVTYQQPKNLLILIDALDECNVSDVRMVVAFLERLSLNAVISKTSLKICLSSRHYPSISMKTALELNIDIVTAHHDDLAAYIRDTLMTTNAKLQEDLIRKAAGVFMWTILAVEMVNKAYDEGDIEAMQKKVETIPSELDELFTGLFKPGDEDPKTILLLQWVLFARVPLSPKELYIAIMAEKGSLKGWNEQRIDDEFIKRYLSTLSKGLVEIRSEEVANLFGEGNEDDMMTIQLTVQFIHETVKDFLLRNKRLQMLDPSLKGNVTAASHDRLRECCFSYIETQSTKIAQAQNDSGPVMAEEFPFLLYASIFVLYHAEEAEKGSMLQQDFFRQLQDPFTFERLKTAHDIWPRFGDLKLGKETGPLYAVSLKGLPHLVKRLLGAGSNVNAQGGYYGNALQAACAFESDETQSIFNNEPVIQLLLEAGANVNAQGGEFSNALQLAAGLAKKENIVKVLLEAGADVNAQGGPYGGALQAAARNSGNEKTVKYLLEAGADVNAQGGECGNPLQAAAYWTEELEDKKIIMLLIEAGADLNTLDAHSKKTLQKMGIPMMD